MGLVERIAQAKAEAAANKQATRLETQRKLQVAEAANLQVQALAVQQEADRKVALSTLIAKLSPLLEVVGAKENLEEVKAIWKVGVIDSTPQLMSESPTPSVGLALRHRFVDIEPIEKYGGDDGGSWYEGQIGTTICQREVALFIITSQIENIPTLQTYYGSRMIDRSTFDRSHCYCSFSGATDFQYYNKTNPEQFQVSDPEQAKLLLENQLFKVLNGIPEPVRMQETAREAINKDSFASLYPAQSYYRSLMKSIRSIQPETSIPWYKKLFL